MTAKEKALELMDKMCMINGHPNIYYKECALIAVDAILKVASTDTFSCKYYDGEFYSDQDYFIQVEKEIEKL